jgi:hypothetical protein
MALYEVDAPNGMTYRLEAPDGTPAEQVSDYFRISLYPDILRKAKPEEKPEPQQSFLRQVADVPLQIGRGAVSGVRMIADAFGPGSAASENLKGAETYIEGLLSAQSRKDSAEIARIMEDAKDKGVYDQVVAAVKSLSVAPVDLVAQGLGTMAPAIIATLATGGTAAIPIGGAVGAAMGAGGIKGAIFEETKKEFMGRGVSEDVATGLAQEAAAYDGKNLNQILIGAGLGATDALTGANRILGNAARRAAGRVAAEETTEVGRGLTARTALGVAGEAPLEALQGGQEQLARNLAIQREGFERPTFQGVAGSAALEGLTGGVIGGASRAAFGRRPDLIPPVVSPVSSGVETPPPAPSPAPPGLAPPSPPGAPPGAAAAASPIQTPGSLQNIAAAAQPGAIPPSPGALQRAPTSALGAVTLPQGTPTNVVIPQLPLSGVAPEPTEVSPLTPQEPVAATPTVEPSTPLPALAALPRDLAGAKPRYSFGSNRFELQFQSDVDKALYITAQLSKSKRDSDYRKWLGTQGYSPSDITRLGSTVRNRIKSLAKQAPGAGVLNVPSIAVGTAPPLARTAPLPGRVTPSMSPALAALYAPPATPAVPEPALAAPAPPTTDLGPASARTPEPLRVKTVKTGVPTIPEIEVAPQIVELSDIISSEIPGYDQTLQPRDRTRAGSDVQVSSIVSAFDPQLLIFDQSTKRGAPIVNSNMNVESGNGRTMALRRIYSAFPNLAEAYKAELTRQGFDISGMKNPVLVQRRVTELTPEQTQQVVKAGNAPDVLLMGPTELAEQDAKRITVGMLDLIPEGRDYTHPAFVLEFLRTVPANELGPLLDKEGALNPDGERRVRNAVFARAFGDSQALIRIAESSDDNIRSISNALIDNLAAFAKLRASVEAGRTDPGFSTDPLIDAINRISRMRTTGTTLEKYLSQIDAFNPVPPMTEKFMRLFYSEKARALGRERISDGLAYYVREALKVSPDGGLGLGIPQITPMELIDAATKRAQKVVQGQTTMALEPVAKQPADPAVVTPAVSPMAVTVANRKRLSSSDLGDVLRPTTRVTFSDGTATDIQRLNAAEADGVPGWHDRSKSDDFYVSYLADTEKKAIAELLKRKNAEKFIPDAVPVGMVAAAQPTDLGPSNQPVIVGEVPQSVKDSTKMNIGPGVSKWFNENLPGVDNVLRELQYRLYPGTQFSINLLPGKRVPDDGPFGRMLPAEIRKGIVTIHVNPERFQGYFGKARGDYRTKLLHSLLHEMSHPIQYFWINNADVDTQAAIFAQFNKERSGTAAQRAGLIRYVLDQGNPSVDTDTLRSRLLQEFRLTENQFQRLIETEADIPSSETDLYRDNLSSNYFRSYNEWVAEKGAQWMSKELQGRLPQTAFEKFQKDIFVRLRSIYETVAKLLGVPTSTGAFEKMLSDIWGVKISTPAGKLGVREGKKNEDTVLNEDAEIAYEKAVDGDPSAISKLPGGDTARLNSEKFAKLTTKVRAFFDPTYMVDKYPILSEFRNLLFGKIGMSTQRARDLSNAISKGTPEVQAQSYTFLTTRDADPNIIADENVRKASIEVKKEINRTAQEMVSKGFLSQESLDKYYDQYLPRMYLYYEATGAGVKSPNRALTDMGYLDFRKELTPEDRELLGEIKNPAFLSYVALTRPQNDLAVAEYFEQIKAQTGVEWIAPNSLVEFQGDMVTPFWLAAEANKMSAIADLTQNTDPVAAERMRNQADEMRRTAGPETERQKIIDLPDNYRRLPDSPRYGVLRGAVIQKGIYDDIVGGIVSISVSDKPWVQALLGDEQSVVVKANQLWKMSKITLNIPSQVRNAISNMLAMNVFGGIPLYRIAPLLARATREISTNGKYWEEAQKYGITGGTMSAAEMIRVRTELEQYLRKGGGKDIFGAFGAARIAAGKAIGVASDTYQAVEVRFKVAMFIHGREKGLSPSAAVDAANESLFDYTLVNPNIRYLRNAPLGLPFVTYYYKALPKLIETAYKHPTRFAPYVALALALPQLTMLALDIDDDDYEALRKSLPEYVRNKGSLFILPYKDESGRWQYIDTAPFFPWAAFSDPIVQATFRQDPGGGLKEAVKLVTPSGPIVAVLAGIATGRDPFTDREIIDPRQTPQNKALALVSYVWNQAMPSMLAIDAVNPQNAAGAIPRLYNDAFGSGTGLDKRGQPKPEFLASAARLFGANINSLEPVNQRALNINFMLNKIRASESLRGQIAKDQSLTPVARQREISALNEKIREDYKKLQEYATETARAASLKK